MRSILVTGATGSFGNECIKYLLSKNEFNRIIIFSRDEYKQFMLSNQLRNHKNYKKLRFFLGDVRDFDRLKLACRDVDVIIHAAALKHVHIVEQNIAECIKNNVLGTLVTAKVAIESQVERFILVSTDKAVNPTNAMGASKRCCELILQALATEKNPSFEPIWNGKSSVSITRNTQFAIVRFGNVLGSSGSVVPYFRQQIAQGGPITLTHQDIVRYFMTVPEAAQLVIQACAMVGGPIKGIGAGISEYRKGKVGSKAEVYVLDMGKPIKIIDLARRMVELSGLRVKDESFPQGDIAFKVIGLRPGEKLYEELLIGKNPQATQHPRIMKANEKFLPWSEMQPMITTLRISAMNGDVIMIRSMLQMLVPEYQPDDKMVDWVYSEKIAQADKLEY